jgi:hypothetical protein
MIKINISVRTCIIIATIITIVGTAFIYYYSMVI